jgi:NADH:ubiquinone oxidoreductase subunit
MKWFKQIFAWWDRSTWGTRLYTWRFGKRVGEDEFGNVYYEGGGRRWVQYSGDVEATKIPPGWHGWMHYRTDVPPPRQAYAPREWETAHQPNLTGTPMAWRPPGSIANPKRRPRVTGDYEAWRP